MEISEMRETIMQEANRLQSLIDYGILDTEAVQELDILTQFTAKLFNVPIGLITLIDKNRQWFKSHYGLEVTETARDIAFCDYTIKGNEVFQIEDTYEDIRFKNNPLVKDEPFIRFYAGAPLTNEKGYQLGSLAIIDRKPRLLTKEEKEILRLLAKQVVNYFELNYKKKNLEKEVEKRTKELKNKISELEAKEKELRLSNTELDSFVYTASHDLKAPISNIEGLMNFLDGSLQDPCRKNIDVIATFEMVKSSVERFKNTIYDLTEISSAKKIIEGQFQVINFQDVLSGILQSLSDLIKVTKTEIHLDISEAPEVQFPGKYLRSILYNLLSNAIKYKSPERNAEIFLKTEKNNDYIILKVKDNGIGIAKENIEKIFQMFKRLHNNIEGSGVGLYLVNKLVNNAGGKIEVDSELGKGSEFKIYFKS